MPDRKSAHVGGRCTAPCPGQRGAPGARSQATQRGLAAAIRRVVAERRPARFIPPATAVARAPPNRAGRAATRRTRVPRSAARRARAGALAVGSRRTKRAARPAAAAPLLQRSASCAPSGRFRPATGARNGREIGRSVRPGQVAPKCIPCNANYMPHHFDVYDPIWASNLCWCIGRTGSRGLGRDLGQSTAAAGQGTQGCSMLYTRLVQLIDVARVKGSMRRCRKDYPVAGIQPFQRHPPSAVESIEQPWQGTPVGRPAAVPWRAAPGRSARFAARPSAAPTGARPVAGAWIRGGRSPAAAPRQSDGVVDRLRW